jgi:ferrochelatase
MSHPSWPRDGAQQAAAILLLAHGGPATPAEVPGFVRDLLGSGASDQRLAALQERYRAIGGASPLPITVKAIGEALARAAGLPVYVGMRHGKPTIANAFSRVVADGTRLLAAIYLSPYLPTLTARRCRESVELCARSFPDAPQVRYADDWHGRREYLMAEADATRAALQRFPLERRSCVRVVFSAHSLPKDAVEAGDPYDRQVLESAELVASLLGLPPERWCVAYQSAPVPGPAWLGPDIHDVITALASQGVDNVVVAPIGFVVDSLEVLYDIDLELTRFARDRGVRLERAPLPNVSAALVSALEGAAQDALSRRDAQKEPV